MDWEQWRTECEAKAYIQLKKHILRKNMCSLIIASVSFLCPSLLKFVFI